MHLGGVQLERRTREKRKMMPFHIFLGLMEKKRKKNLVEHKSALPNQRQPLFLSCYLYYMCCPDFNSTTRRKGMAGVGNSGISRTTSNMHPHKCVNLLTEKQQNKTNKQTNKIVIRRQRISSVGSVLLSVDSLCLLSDYKESIEF